MTDVPMDERKFTDREVHQILKKAVEKAPSRALTRSEGLSLAELKAIAQEVGIDPARVEDAARSLAQRQVNQANPLVGAPTVLDFERRVAADFDPSDTPEVLSLIRRTMGLQGEVNEIHGSLEWRAAGDAGERYVTLASRDGTTTIRGSANLTNTAVLTYLPAGMIGVISSMVGLIKFVQDGSMVGLVVCLAVLPVLYPILRTILKKISDSEAKKLDRVVTELAQLTSGSGGGRESQEAP